MIDFKRTGTIHPEWRFLSSEVVEDEVRNMFIKPNNKTWGGNYFIKNIFVFLRRLEQSVYGGEQHRMLFFSLINP